MRRIAAVEGYGVFPTGRMLPERPAPAGVTEERLLGAENRRFSAGRSRLLPDPVVCTDRDVWVCGLASESAHSSCELL